MNLREFLNTYEGFDFTQNEMVLVNQRTGYHKIGKLSYLEQFDSFCECMDKPVYTWTHTDKTMLIVL